VCLQREAAKLRRTKQRASQKQFSADEKRLVVPSVRPKEVVAGMSDAEILEPHCASRAEISVRLSEYAIKHEKFATCAKGKKGALGLLRVPLFEKYGNDGWPDKVPRLQPRVLAEIAHHG
jgi:hypothetical protein